MLCFAVYGTGIKIDLHTGRTTSTKIWGSGFSRQSFWNTSATTFGYVQCILSYFIHCIMIPTSSVRVKQINNAAESISIFKMYYGGRTSGGGLSSTWLIAIKKSWIISSRFRKHCELYQNELRTLFLSSFIKPRLCKLNPRKKNRPHFTRYIFIFLFYHHICFDKFRIWFSLNQQPQQNSKKLDTGRWPNTMSTLNTTFLFFFAGKFKSKKLVYSYIYIYIWVEY